MGAKTKQGRCKNLH